MSSAARNALNQQAEDVLALDPDVEMSNVEELGLQWASKDEEANILEETKKTLLAQFVRDEQTGSRATGGKGLPMNQAENNALADPRYEGHLRAMVAARAEANRARVKYDTAKVRIDLLRSLVAARREEMRLGGTRT